MDGARFAMHMEAAYQQAWREWIGVQAPYHVDEIPTAELVMQVPMPAGSQAQLGYDAKADAASKPYPVVSPNRPFSIP